MNTVEKWTKSQVIAAAKDKGNSMIVEDSFGRYRDFSPWHAKHLEDITYSVRIAPHEIIIHWPE